MQNTYIQNLNHFQRLFTTFRWSIHDLLICSYGRAIYEINVEAQNILAYCIFLLYFDKKTYVINNKLQHHDDRYVIDLYDVFLKKIK